MIYHLSLFLRKYSLFFNVIHYISVRAILALLSSFFFSIIFGSWFIKKLSTFLASGRREFTPENHAQKNKTPTMGGIVIIISVFFAAFLFCNLTDLKIWLTLLAVFLFGYIGFTDDIQKVFYKKGICAKRKFWSQFVAATVVAVLWALLCEPDFTIHFPFFKQAVLHLGIVYIAWAIFVMISASNAVNITDGLDGLATGSLIYNFATFAIITYLAGNSILSIYLHIPYSATGELAVLCAAFVGALLGFLWYNTYPAQVFMGDVGSLALGAGLACIALFSKQEILLLISGGLFVIETVSVIAQVISFRYFKRRIFKMAPIHHHFELLGWPESKITTRFAIVSFILCLLCLITLKLR